MSHFTVLVLGDDVDGQLAGHEETSYGGKWDWYEVGGRWDGGIPLKDGTGVNECRAGDIDLDKVDAFALVKDGQWSEQGQMGWFGMSTNDMPEEEWDAIVRKTLAEADPDTRVTLIDAHI